MARAVVANEKKAPIVHEREQETANTRYNPPQPVYNDCVPPPPLTNATCIFISQPQTDALLQVLFSKLKKQIDKGFDKIMATFDTKVAEIMDVVAAEGMETRDAFTASNALVTALQTRIAELEAQQAAGELTPAQETQLEALKTSIQDIFTAAPVDPPVDPNA